MLDTTLIDNNLAIGLVAGILLFVLGRRLIARIAQGRAMNAHYHQELHRVLNSPEHKVRGRFE